MTLQSTGCRAGRDLVGRRIADLGPWFHNLHLPSGHETAPDHPLGDFPAYKWRQLAPHLPEDLAGWRALDVGCNAGFYSFELARRGADVVGVDSDEHYLRQARWARSKLSFPGRARFRRTQVYDLGRTRRQYDLILFMGVLYHLRYPLLALDLVASLARRLLVLQTLTMPGNGTAPRWQDLPLDRRELLARPGWPKMAFVEHRLANDPTNWWVPNEEGVRAMARSAGLDVIASPGHEIYLCRPLDQPESVRRELGSVFGA